MSQNAIITQPVQSDITTLVQPQAIATRSILTMSGEELSRLKLLAEMLAVSQLTYSKVGSKPATAGDLFIMMLKGVEVGLEPMATLDLISLIGGKPALGPQGMLALIYRSGRIEDIKFEDDGTTAIVTVKRRGMVPHVERFSAEDAQRYMTSEYQNGVKITIPLSEKHNWKSQPATMRMWRCISAMCRKVFPDVIQGLLTPEELDPDVALDAEGNVARIADRIPHPVPTNITPISEAHPQQPPANVTPIPAQPTVTHNGNGHVTVATPLGTPTGQRIPAQPEQSGQSEPTKTWPCIELVDDVYGRVKTALGVDDYQKSEFAKANGVTNYADLGQWVKIATGRKAYENAIADWNKPAQASAAAQPEPTALDNLRNADIESIRESDNQPQEADMPAQAEIYVTEMEDSNDLVRHFQVRVVSATYAIPQKKGESPFLVFPVGDKRITKQVRCYGRSDKFKAMIGEEAYNKYGFNQYDDKRNGGVMLPLHPRLVLDIIEKGSYYSVENAWIDQDDVTF